MSLPLYNRCHDERCYACKAEEQGCPCDGALDDGCWQCRPKKWVRPPCGPWTAETVCGVEREP